MFIGRKNVRSSGNSRSRGGGSTGKRRTSATPYDDDPAPTALTIHEDTATEDKQLNRSPELRESDEESDEDSQGSIEDAVVMLAGRQTSNSTPGKRGDATDLDSAAVGEMGHEKAVSPDLHEGRAGVSAHCMLTEEQEECLFKQAKKELK